MNIDRNQRLWYILAITASLTLQCIISGYGYSGCNKPPMYGDFEAHRHWMEITNHIPVGEWYENSTVNDLNYWGIDYPPLAGYHSWMLGRIVRMIDRPKWIELLNSHGNEDTDLKFYMRLTVILTSMLTYVPGFLLISKHLSLRPPSLAAICTLANPVLLIVDNGHFQYNCLPIGLTLLAVSCLLSAHWTSGTIFYTMAIFSKQMAFYYSIPIVTYCLKHIAVQRDFRLFLQMSCTSVVTALLLCLPYLSPPSKFIQMMSRVLPLKRGIFEDKVANFWSTINIIYKVKNNHSERFLFGLSGLLTLTAQMPSILFLNRSNLVLCMFSGSLAFFLFSFQVHEKSIVFPSVLAGLLVCRDQCLFSWFLEIAFISLFPLLRKDQLSFVACCLLGMFHFLSELFPSNNSQLTAEMPPPLRSTMPVVRTISFWSGISLAVPVILNVKSPVDKYPDIFVVALYAFCFVHFVVFEVSCLLYLIFVPKHKKSE